MEFIGIYKNISSTTSSLVSHTTYYRDYVVILGNGYAPHRSRRSGKSTVENERTDNMIAEAYGVADDVVDCYGSYGASISIKRKWIQVLEDRYVFRIKLLPGTRVDSIKRHARDVQMALRLPLFHVEEDGMFINIVASKEAGTHYRLPHILKSPIYKDAQKQMSIAHPIGFDVTNTAVINDLTKYPHLMVCGTTGSGKTTALLALLASLIFGYRPSRLRLLICDMAATLSQFSDAPHLAYPVVEDFDTFSKAMQILEKELERRMGMKHSIAFSRLPTIVCVIDEFTKFMSGTDDKQKLALVKTTITNILRRARHVKIHLVIAAHNPIVANMKIDISDLPTKMIFKVSRPVNSVTVIGVGGAEKLSGNGDMYFQSSTDSQLQRIQGAYVSPKDIVSVLNYVRSRHDSRTPEQMRRDSIYSSKYGFVITESDMEGIESDTHDTPIIVPVKRKQSTEDSLFPEVFMWALTCDSISNNMICDNFGIGFRRANGLLERLQQLEVAGSLYAKLARPILPVCLDDLSPDVITLMNEYGYTTDDISNAIHSKREVARGE